MIVEWLRWHFIQMDAKHWPVVGMALSIFGSYPEKTPNTAPKNVLPVARSSVRNAAYGAW